MARLLSESFELCSNATPTTAYNWDVVTIGGSNFVIDTGTPIDGARSFRNASSAGYLQKNASTAEAFVGLYINPIGLTDAAPIISFYGASAILGTIRLNTLGNLYAQVNGITVATGGSTLSVGITQHIQIRYKVDDAAGSIQVKLNDIATPYEIDFTGDTKPVADATITRIRLEANFATMDDVVINDTSGAADNTWPGIVRFATLSVTGNGNYTGGWLKNSGSAADYTYVDENPNDGDTTYLYTTVTNTYASFSMSDQSLTNVTYKALLTHAIARKDGGTAKLAIGIRDNDNSTNYIAGLKDLGVSYGIVTERRTTDPSTGTTWTSAGINATEALIISTA